MTLRTKLLLAQLPLALALVATSLVSLRISQGLGQSSRSILRDNFRSVLACQHIKDAVDGLDGIAVARVLGVPDSPAVDSVLLRDRLEAELRVQESNVTEVGESEATVRLRKAWTTYQQAWGRLAVGPAAAATYRGELQPALQKLRASADEVLALNLDAMVARNERVQTTVADFDTLLVLVTLGACLAGLLASVTLTARMLRPLGVLTQAVRRIGSGDLGARVVLEGQDEIAELASEFNTMTDRLETYRRSSLGELLEVQQASQAAIDSLPDPVLAFDASAELMNVNQAAERLLGITVEKGVDALSAHLPAMEHILRVRVHVLGGKGPYLPKGFEEAFRMMTPEGERYFLLRGMPVYAENALCGATVLLQDVTRLRLFDELTHDLVATVAHEFRTPLTSLRMAVHLCLEQVAGPTTEKQADLLQAAREDCERLQTMVDDLLNVARIQSGRAEFERRPIAVGPFLKEAVGPHEKEAQSHEVELVVEPVPEGLMLEGDPVRLELVFANLLGNAVRYTPRGGRMELRTSLHGAFVRFELSDTGQGIPPEYREHIFDKFFQLPGAPKGGAGLGLHIAREVVRAHGGEMGVVDRDGGGSTFWFTLPVSGPPARRS